MIDPRGVVHWRATGATAVRFVRTTGAAGVAAGTRGDTGVVAVYRDDTGVGATAGAVAGLDITAAFATTASAESNPPESANSLLASTLILYLLLKLVNRQGICLWLSFS